tara:strand:- start:5 stop:178 length:174 start_codon:yes stop_codon:yes gene_type:complete
MLGIKRYEMNAKKKLKKTTIYRKFIVASKILLKPTKKPTKKLKVIVICSAENILNLK